MLHLRHLGIARSSTKTSSQIKSAEVYHPASSFYKVCKGAIYRIHAIPRAQSGYVLVLRLWLDLNP